MPQKIPNETRRLIEKLYDEDLSAAEIARRTNVPYTTAYGYIRAKEEGFASPTEYQKYLAEKKHASYQDYLEFLAEENGYASRRDYRKDLVKKKGYASLAKYSAHLDSEKQKRLLNKRLSRLLKQKLAEIEKNKSWLAKQLGITRGTVSKYCSGKMMPRKELQEKLFSLLGVPYQTIDDLLVELK